MTAVSEPTCTWCKKTEGQHTLDVIEGRTVRFCDSSEQHTFACAVPEPVPTEGAGERIVRFAYVSIGSAFHLGTQGTVEFTKTDEDHATAEGRTFTFGLDELCRVARPAPEAAAAALCVHCEEVIERSGFDGRTWVHKYSRRTECGSKPTLAAPIAPAAEEWIQELVDALWEAAQSLRTIADGAGRREFMEHMDQVRGYANSRANVAHELAAEYRKGAKND